MKLEANKEFMENLSSHFTPVIVKCMKNNLDKTKPRQYSEQILPVSWLFVIRRSSIAHMQTIKKSTGSRVT